MFVRNSGALSDENSLWLSLDALPARYGTGTRGQRANRQVCAELGVFRRLVFGESYDTRTSAVSKRPQAFIYFLRTPPNTPPSL